MLIKIFTCTYRHFHGGNVILYHNKTLLFQKENPIMIHISAHWCYGIKDAWAEVRVNMKSVASCVSFVQLLLHMLVFLQLCTYRNELPVKE